MPLTEQQVREILKDSPALDPEDWSDLTESANEDPGESVEWLPYYKMAIKILLMSLGEMSAVAVKGIDIARKAHPESGHKMTTCHLHAAEVSALFLRILGHGPDGDPKRKETVERIIERDWKPAMHEWFS